MVVCGSEAKKWSKWSFFRYLGFPLPRTLDPRAAKKAVAQEIQNRLAAWDALPFSSRTRIKVVNVILQPLVAEGVGSPMANE